MMRIGTEDTFETHFSLSQEDVQRFAEVTGDKNPIHLDAEYASKTRFKSPIVHGFLGGSIFSRTLGTEFPGEGTIYVKQEMNFRRPMRVGVEYVAKFAIREIIDDKHMADIWCEILDPSGEICLDGLARVYHPDRF